MGIRNQSFRTEEGRDLFNHWREFLEFTIHEICEKLNCRVLSRQIDNILDINIIKESGIGEIKWHWGKRSATILLNLGAGMRQNCCCFWEVFWWTQCACKAEGQELRYVIWLGFSYSQHEQDVWIVLVLWIQ